MRKIAIALLLVAAVLMLTVGPSLAGSRGGGGRGGGGNKGGHGGGHKGGHHHGGHKGHHHAHSTVVFGFGGWGWGYPYWYPPYYPYYPYYYPPSPPQEPPVYIEQSTQATQPPSSYWYYCQSASAYYPSTPSCPEAWIKVAPRTE
jgi:hypothetical protein